MNAQTNETQKADWKQLNEEIQFRAKREITLRSIAALSGLPIKVLTEETAASTPFELEIISRAFVFGEFNENRLNTCIEYAVISILFRKQMDVYNSQMERAKAVYNKLKAIADVHRIEGKM